VILLFLNQQLLIIARTIMLIEFKSHLLCLYPSPHSHLADLPLRQSVCKLLQHLVNFGITPELNCNSFSSILSIKTILPICIVNYMEDVILSAFNQIQTSIPICGMVF